MLMETSFTSSGISSCSFRKPDEPSPMSSTLSTLINVRKNFPRGPAAWLEDGDIKTNIYIYIYIGIKTTIYRTLKHSFSNECLISASTKSD